MHDLPPDPDLGTTDCFAILLDAAFRLGLGNPAAGPWTTNAFLHRLARLGHVKAINENTFKNWRKAEAAPNLAGKPDVRNALFEAFGLVRHAPGDRLESHARLWIGVFDRVSARDNRANKAGRKLAWRDYRAEQRAAEENILGVQLTEIEAQNRRSELAAMEDVIAGIDADLARQANVMGAEVKEFARLRQQADRASAAAEMRRIIERRQDDEAFTARKSETYRMLRLGLAHTYYELRDFAAAEAAYCKVLELTPLGDRDALREVRPLYLECNRELARACGDEAAARLRLANRFPLGLKLGTADFTILSEFRSRYDDHIWLLEEARKASLDPSTRSIARAIWSSANAEEARRAFDYARGEWRSAFLYNCLLNKLGPKDFGQAAAIVAEMRAGAIAPDAYTLFELCKRADSISQLLPHLEPCLEDRAALNSFVFRQLSRLVGSSRDFAKLKAAFGAEALPIEIENLAFNLVEPGDWKAALGVYTDIVNRRGRDNSTLAGLLRFAPDFDTAVRRYADDVRRDTQFSDRPLQPLPALVSALQQPARPADRLRHFESISWRQISRIIEQIPEGSACSTFLLNPLFSLAIDVAGFRRIFAAVAARKIAIPTETLKNGFAKARDFAEAEALRGWLEDEYGLVPTADSFKSILKLATDLDSAIAVIDEMLDAGIRPLSDSFASVVRQARSREEVDRVIAMMNDDTLPGGRIPLSTHVFSAAVSRIPNYVPTAKFIDQMTKGAGLKATADVVRNLCNKVRTPADYQDFLRRIARAGAKANHEDRSALIGGAGDYALARLIYLDRPRGDPGDQREHFRILLGRARTPEQLDDALALWPDATDADFINRLNKADDLADAMAMLDYIAARALPVSLDCLRKAASRATTIEEVAAVLAYGRRHGCDQADEIMRSLASACPDKELISKIVALLAAEGAPPDNVVFRIVTERHARFGGFDQALSVIAAG